MSYTKAEEKLIWKAGKAIVPGRRQAAIKEWQQMQDDHPTTFTTVRQPQSFVQKHVRMVQIYKEIRKLVRMDEFRWDVCTKTVVAPEHCWTALSNSADDSDLLRWRNKACHFLQPADFIKRKRKLHRPQNLFGRVEKTKVNIVTAGNEDEDEKSNEAATRQSPIPDAEPEAALIVDDVHGPDVIDLTEDDNEPVLKQEASDLFVTLPSPSQPISTLRAASVAQLVPSAPAIVLGLHVPGTPSQDRDLYTKVRAQLIKEGAWLKTAGRMKAIAIFRADAIFADQYLEENDETRKFILKGILRDSQQGHPSELFDDA